MDYTLFKIHTVQQERGPFLSHPYMLYMSCLTSLGFLFQIHTGNQHYIAWPERATAMPLTLPGHPDVNIATLADKLKEVDYSTHYIGKWHVGLFQTRYWPTERGFDTFLGNY